MSLSSLSSSNYTFIKKRVIVHWGGYNLVQAILNSIEEIIQSNNKPDLVILLSGMDYPIKKISFIKLYLKENKEKVLIACAEITSF